MAAVMAQTWRSCSARAQRVSPKAAEKLGSAGLQGLPVSGRRTGPRRGSGPDCAPQADSLFPLQSLHGAEPGLSISLAYLQQTGQAAHIVAVHRAQVGKAHILKQAARQKGPP